MTIHPGLQLRRRLAEGKPLLVPGAHDALSARLIAQAGFEALIVSGFGVAATSLGVPDLEIYTRGDNLHVVRNVTLAVDIPVMADGDNGYGNALGVMRTIREFEAAGVASLTLEDQQSPKSCPLLADTQGALIALDEAVGKLQAAVQARRNHDMLIIARTDARSMHEAMARAAAYARAGADMIKLISPAVTSLDMLRTIHQACGKPLMLSNLGWIRNTPRQALCGMVGVLTEPMLALRAAAKAMHSGLQALAQDVPPSPELLMPLGQLEDVLGLAGFRELEREFLRG